MLYSINSTSISRDSRRIKDIQPYIAIGSVRNIGLRHLTRYRHLKPITPWSSHLSTPLSTMEYFMPREPQNTIIRTIRQKEVLMFLFWSLVAVHAAFCRLISYLDWEVCYQLTQQTAHALTYLCYSEIAHCRTISRKTRGPESPCPVSTVSGDMSSVWPRHSSNSTAWHKESRRLLG